MRAVQRLEQGRAHANAVCIAARVEFEFLVGGFTPDVFRNVEPTALVVENLARRDFGTLDIRLVEGVDLHEPTAECHRVFPDEEVARHGRAVRDVEAEDGDVGMHAGTGMFERFVAVHVAQNRATVGVRVGKDAGVDFDVGQYANTRLAERLRDELLDPQTEDLLARRHEQ